MQVRVDLLSVCPQSDFTSRMFRPSPADDSGGGSEQVFRMDRMSVVDPYGGAWSLQGDLHAKYLRFTLSQLANNMPDNHLRYYTVINSACSMMCTSLNDVFASIVSINHTNLLHFYKGVNSDHSKLYSYFVGKLYLLYHVNA